MQIGDRYQFYIHDAFGHIVEYTEKGFLVIEGEGVGRYGNFDVLNDIWYTYIGNFSKSTNFSNLYSILNEEAFS